MLVVALVPSEFHRGAVRRMMTGVAHVCFCDTHDEMLTVASARPVRAFLLHATDADATCTTVLVTSLRCRHPLVPVILYCDLSVESVRHVPVLTRAGGDHLVLPQDEPQSVAGVLRSTMSDRFAHAILEQLGPLAPLPAHQLIVHCLSHPRAAGTVATVARELGISRRTMTSRLAAAGMPAAGELIGWCRLLAAARILDDGSERGLESVAFAAGFHSGSALRAMLRRYIGQSPVAIRSHGAVRVVLDAFRQALIAADGTALPVAS